MQLGRTCLRWSAALLLVGATHAGVLPEDRADVLFHRYEGGGITIQGPSVLVRKKLNESVSLAGNYYVDAISSASAASAEVSEVATSAAQATDSTCKGCIPKKSETMKAMYSLPLIR